MSSPPGGWSPLKITGQAPPPCSYFILTTVGEKRAAMYGGWDGLNSRFNHLFIVELGRHSVVSVITRSVCSKIPKTADYISWDLINKIPNTLYHIIMAMTQFTLFKNEGSPVAIVIT